MGYETIIFQAEGAVGTITLNRPESLNAFNFQMGEDFNDALHKCSHDSTIRAVVITGAGRAFCSGGDVKGMREFTQANNQAFYFKKLTSYLHSAISAIRRMEKPVIMGVNGIASGAGFNLALAGDIIIASDRAQFNQAYIRLGVCPDGGGTYFLPRLIGDFRAAELFFTADMIDAQRALQLGIVNRVVPEEEFPMELKRWAEKLASAPTKAIGAIKKLLLQSQAGSLESQLENERQAVTSCSHTEDFLEGLNAFFEKRKPAFKGR